jgi:hypothetical protein
MFSSQSEIQTARKIDSKAVKTNAVELKGDNSKYETWKISRACSVFKSFYRTLANTHYTSKVMQYENIFKNSLHLSKPQFKMHK